MNELVIFDFDFTIAKTIEQIWVWSPRGNEEYNSRTYNRIRPTELQQLGLGDDETIDDDSFTEFYDIDTEKAKPISCIVPYLKYYTIAGTVYILSARPQIVQDKVILFLEKQNINTKNINFIGLKHSSPDKKIEYINTLILKQKINKIILFEDNKNIIDIAINTYKQNFNINIYYIQNHTDKTIITFYEND